MIKMNLEVMHNRMMKAKEIAKSLRNMEADGYHILIRPHMKVGGVVLFIRLRPATGSQQGAFRAGQLYDADPVVLEHGEHFRIQAGVPGRAHGPGVVVEYTVDHGDHSHAARITGHGSTPFSPVPVWLRQLLPGLRLRRYSTARSPSLSIRTAAVRADGPDDER